VPAAAIGPIAGIATLIPGIGQAVGVTHMIGVSTIGGATTYAIGEVFIQHFEAGGTFLTFDPEKVRKHFEAEFEKGTQVVAELKQGEASLKRSQAAA
jgi:predicted exporter